MILDTDLICITSLVSTHDVKNYPMKVVKVSPTS